MEFDSARDITGVHSVQYSARIMSSLRNSMRKLQTRALSKHSIEMGICVILRRQCGNAY